MKWNGIRKRGFTRPSHCPKVNSIKLLELCEAVRRHIVSPREVVFRTPVKRGEVEGKCAAGFCERVEYAGGGVSDVHADAVARDAGDAVDFGSDGVGVGGHCRWVWSGLGGSWKVSIEVSVEVVKDAYTVTYVWGVSRMILE
jgi:hypothetical protein